MSVTIFAARLGGAGLAGVALLAQPVSAQDLKPALSAEVRFLGDAGPLTAIPPGAPFRIELTFTSAAGPVPADLRPMGWLRPVSPSDLPCGETAAAWRATGHGPLGGVELNGVVLGVLAEDDGFVIADPSRNVGSANLIAAQRFAVSPAALVADARQGLFVLSDPAAGEIRTVDPLGAERVLAGGLDRPGALVPAASGGVWALEEGTGDVLRIGAPAPRPGDDAVRRLPLSARALPPVDTAATGGRMLALMADGLAVLEDDGTERLRIPAPAALDAGLTAQAALWLSPDALHVLWLDAPDAPQAIPLAGHFDALAVSPEGRFAVVFSHSRTGFGMVDLALGRMVQGAGTTAPVAEVAFLPGVAALRLADQSAVGVIDFDLVRPGQEATVGSLPLGPAATEAGGALLAPFLPEPAMLAVHGPSFTGFMLDRRNAISGKPPMEAIRLRGGIPRIVRALDRGLRDEGGGRFATVARLPRGGAWQLVVSAGVGQMAFCAPVPAMPEVVAVEEPGHLRAVAAEAGRVRLRLTRAGGVAAAGVTGELDFAALAGNGRARQSFVTDAEGLTVDSYALSPPVVVQVHGRGGPFLPFVLEEAP